MINAVRNIVLSVLNKNNYGYISPADFNLYAANAQMEIYEEYFSNYNKVINDQNLRRSGTDYADILKPIEEVIELFANIERTLTQVTVGTNRYYLPSLTTTGNEAFMISNIYCFHPTTNARLGEAESVSVGKINMLLNSPLTTPNIYYPSYILSEGIVTVYPTTINGVNSIKATYFSYPKVPKWTYNTLANGEPIFNQSQPDYQDFQLPLEDEYKLAMKILQYCGISIREQQVVQYGMIQEQNQQLTVSQQQ
jgi:hypothetical protein